MTFHEMVAKIRAGELRSIGFEVCDVTEETPTGIRIYTMPTSEYNEALLELITAKLREKYTFSTLEDLAGQIGVDRLDSEAREIGYSEVNAFDAKLVEEQKAKTDKDQNA